MPHFETFLAILWLRLQAPNAGRRVGSLAWESLHAAMPHGATTTTTTINKSQALAFLPCWITGLPNPNPLLRAPTPVSVLPALALGDLWTSLSQTTLLR